MLPSPERRGLGLRSLFLSRPPVGSLSLRPGDSLTIPSMALSISFTRFVSSTDVIQTTRLLTLAPVGLTPTEHASLRWTHSLPKTLSVTAKAGRAGDVRHDTRVGGLRGTGRARGSDQPDGECDDACYAALAYRWWSPPRCGIATTSPLPFSTDRGNGELRSRHKCVRDSL